MWGKLCCFVKFIFFVKKKSSFNFFYDIGNFECIIMILIKMNRNGIF